MNKFLNGIGILFVLLLLSCCGRKEVQQLEGQDGNETYAVLAEIDSLMWQRPDSALAVLLDFAASPKADSLDAFNGHYTQLLASELLYKNDYQQSNRAELRQAVAYFDSLMMDGTGTRSVSLPFLTARAHYINGVGFYERDSVVEACAEYLISLEIMENHFEEKELVGHKARFMTLTNNRLLDLFSDQFMQEPAIVCAKQSLFYDEIEHNSPYSHANILYRIGLQYDKLEEMDSAALYFKAALKAFPDRNTLVYRDLIASLALFEYKSHHETADALDSLKSVAAQAVDEAERLARFFTIGAIYYLERQYDSSKVYLEPVYEKDVNRKKMAAERLREIALKEGDILKADVYAQVLLEDPNTEAESNAQVSQLEGLFNNYLSKKQEIQTAKEHHDAILRTSKIIIVIAVVVGVFIVILMKLRNRKKLIEVHNEEEKRHAEVLEAEQQAHRMEQAALSGRLKRSNEKLRDVSKQLEETLAKNSLLESETSDDYSAYINTPICLYIINLVHKQQFKSKMDYLIYKDDALSKEQLLALRDAAEKHLARFTSHIRKRFPNLTDNDMDYCYLFLLGLGEADISALMQRAYTTVCDRSRKISRIIGANDSLYQTLRNMLYDN